MRGTAEPWLRMLAFLLWLAHDERMHTFLAVPADGRRLNTQRMGQGNRC